MYVFGLDALCFMYKQISELKFLCETFYQMFYQMAQIGNFITPYFKL